MSISKKRLFASVALTVYLVTATLNAFAYTVSNKVVFDEKFSSYAVNGRVAYHPGGDKVNSSLQPATCWNWSEAYNTNCENGVVVDSDEGDKFAKLYSDGSSAAVSLVSDKFGDLLTNYIISAKIKLTGNVAGGLGLIASDAAYSTDFPIECLIFFENGTVYKNDGSGSFESTEYSYNIDEWYNIRFYINRSNYTYNIRLYDAESDISISGNMPATLKKNKIRFSCQLDGEYDGNLCIDDVLICKVGTQNIPLDSEDSFVVKDSTSGVSLSNNIVLTTSVPLVDIPDLDDVLVIDGKGEKVDIESVILDNIGKKLTIKLSDTLAPMENYRIVFSERLRNACGESEKTVSFSTEPEKVDVQQPQIYIDGAASSALKQGVLSCTINVAPQNKDANPSIALALYKDDIMISFSEGNGILAGAGNNSTVTSANLTIPEGDITSYKVGIYLWDYVTRSPLTSYWILNSNSIAEIVGNSTLE